MKYFVILLVFVLVGCSDNIVKTNNVNAVIDNTTTNSYKRQSPYTNKNLVDSPHEFDEKSKDEDLRSDKISKTVCTMKNVDKAIVTINGDSCLVDIEISGVKTDEELIKLKNDVKEKVSAIDKNFSIIAVTINKELAENSIEKEESPVEASSEEGKIIEKLTPKD